MKDLVLNHTSYAKFTAEVSKSCVFHATRILRNVRDAPTVSPVMSEEDIANCGSSLTTSTSESTSRESAGKDKKTSKNALQKRTRIVIVNSD